MPTTPQTSAEDRTVQISARIPEEWWVALNARARRNDRSASAELRRLIREGLEQEQEAA